MIAIAVVLVLLAACIVILFAMFGELAAKGPSAGDGTSAPAGQVLPLTDAPIGKQLTSWPLAIGPVFSEARGLLLILSTTCSTCNVIASTLVNDLATGPPRCDEIAVLVSCPDPESGERFVESHDLQGVPHAMDVGGDYSREALGLALSPVAILLSAGMVRGAVGFTSIGELRRFMEKEEGALWRQEVRVATDIERMPQNAAHPLSR